MKKTFSKFLIIPSLLLTAPLLACEKKPKFGYKTVYTLLGYILREKGEAKPQVRGQDYDFSNVEVIAQYSVSDEYGNRYLMLHEEKVTDYTIIPNEYQENVVYFIGEGFTLRYEFELVNPEEVDEIIDTFCF